MGAAASAGTPLPNEQLEAEVDRCLPLYEQVLAHRMRPAPVLPDARNAEILVHVGGALLPRSEAKVSVFDSSVQGGDAVWEGLRIYDNKVFQLEEHIDRLLASAHTMPVMVAAGGLLSIGRSAFTRYLASRCSHS